MYGKATYTKVNQLRYDSFTQKYQSTLDQVLNAWYLFPPCIALFVLLLAKYHWKRMFKEPITRHSYQFPNVPSHEWHSWKVDDDGSSFLSGLVVKLHNRID